MSTSLHWRILNQTRPQELRLQNSLCKTRAQDLPNAKNLVLRMGEVDEGLSQCFYYIFSFKPNLSAHSLSSLSFSFFIWKPFFVCYSVPATLFLWGDRSFSLFSLALLRCVLGSELSSWYFILSSINRLLITLEMNPGPRTISYPFPRRRSFCLFVLCFSPLPQQQLVFTCVVLVVIV